MTNREHVVLQFKKQLKEEFVKGTHILVLFRMYIGFLRTFAGHTDIFDYRQFEEWQLEDMEMTIYNQNVDYKLDVLETALCYTRRGGKTKALTVIAVFFAILDKIVIWRSPYSDQLDQADIWFQLNPFVKQVRVHIDNTVLIYGSETINIAPMTRGRVASRGADVIIYDEGCNIKIDSAMYRDYKNSTPMIAASNFKHIIHASTQARWTVFHETWEYLKAKEKQYNTVFTSLHTYKDCNWITEEYVETEKQKNIGCPWYVQQNYLCLAVNYGGNYFTNYLTIDNPLFPKAILKNWYKITPTHGGVDFNGEITKHYLVLIYYTDFYVMILREYKFTDLEFLRQYCDNSRLSIEIEDGALFNSTFGKECRELGLSARYYGWDNKGFQERARAIQRRTILIDQFACPDTYKNVVEAAFDPKSREPILFKEKGAKSPHGLDCVMHGMHNTSGNMYVSIPNVKRDLLGRLEMKELRI